MVLQSIFHWQHWKRGTALQTSSLSNSSPFSVFLIRSNTVEIFTQIANTPPVQATTLDVEGTYSMLNPNINDISSFTISTTFPSARAFAPGLPDNAADAYIHELQLLGILLALMTDWDSE